MIYFGLHFCFEIEVLNNVSNGWIITTTINTYRLLTRCYNCLRQFFISCVLQVNVNLILTMLNVQKFSQFNTLYVQSNYI